MPETRAGTPLWAIRPSSYGRPEYHAQQERGQTFYSPMLFRAFSPSFDTQGTAAIGTSHFTPAYEDFMATSRRFGYPPRARYGQDEPDAGGYQLNMIAWNKDTGTGSFMPFEPTDSAWVLPCTCPPDSGGCQCR